MAGLAHIPRSGSQVSLNSVVGAPGAQARGCLKDVLQVLTNLQHLLADISGFRTLMTFHLRGSICVGGLSQTFRIPYDTCCAGLRIPERDAGQIRIAFSLSLRSFQKLCTSPFVRYDLQLERGTYSWAGLHGGMCERLHVRLFNAVQPFIYHDVMAGTLMAASASCRQGVLRVSDYSSMGHIVTTALG
jgi:hypothetical protein